MTSDEIITEIGNRLYNALLGCVYGPIHKKILKITLHQLFVDELIVVPFKPGGAMILPGEIHDVKLHITLTR